MRRSCGWLVVVGILACAACAQDPPPPSGASAPTSVEARAGSDWPCFLGPTGDSKSSERGILTRWPAAGPPIVWKLEVGKGYCMPVISDGRLFVFDRDGARARLQCLDAATAEALWKFEYPTDFEDLYGYDNGPRSSPVVDDGRVYIFGAEGMLHCLDAASGKLVWKIDTAAEFGVIQNFFGVGSTPVVDGELLLVNVGGSPPESRKAPPARLDLVVGNGSGIVAFEKATGKVKYKITDELASYASPKLTTIDGRRWCFMFARGGLVGFEPQSGKVDFQFPWRASVLESVNASNPVVVGDRVFISETYGPGSALLRVRPGGAEVEWSDEARRRDKAMQTHWNTPIHLDGCLYGSSGRHTQDAELRCIALDSGKVQWSEPNLTRSSLLYIDSHLVCLSEDGTLRLLRVNPEKYDPVAEVNLVEKSEEPNAFGFGGRQLLKYPAWAAPIVSHGLLYVRGADRLVCLELIPGSRPQP